MVPADSCRISRAPHYSGTGLVHDCGCRLRGCHPLRRGFPTASPNLVMYFIDRPYNPAVAVTTTVWALARSLATTGAIIGLFSLPPGTEMFQFPGFASPLREILSVEDSGLPHSEICGSKDICSFPQLIAAYHVLLRLREPRHPSCALLSFLYDLVFNRFEHHAARSLKLFSLVV